MTDLATLQQRLAEAETALHNALLGNAPTVVVDQNGERIEYSRTRPGDLNKYIQSLRWQIAQLQGTAVTGGPLRPVF